MHGLRALRLAVVGLLAAFLPAAGAAEAEKETKMLNMVEEGFAEIRNPKDLGVTRIPVERVYLGKYYKPNIARLPNNELRIVGMDCEPDHDFYGKNEHPIFRSTDGGRTWSKLAAMDVARGEPYLVTLRDGALLATGGSSTPEGPCFLHRSEDGGQTWTSLPTATVPGGSSKGPSRNVLELGDGSLMAGFWDRHNDAPEKGQENCIWRSFDGGRTWSEKYRVEVEGVPVPIPYPAFEEVYLWQAKSGKIYAILRVDSHAWPIPDQPPGPDAGTNDNFDHMILYVSTDMGRTWQMVRYFGHYGEHYPSILRLHDGRLLLTFTMREAFEPNVLPHGLRAIVGRETQDDLEFDFRHDRIMLDTKGPHARYPVAWSGSIGGTVQVDDGTLVSVYAYGGYPDGDSKRNIDFDAEVIRWRLPEPKE